MLNILVTGGAGNVGGALAEHLTEHVDGFVTVIDNLSTGSPSKLPPATRPNWRFIKCDVNSYDDLAAVMLGQRFDYVFHYAAVVGVARTLANPVAVLEDIQGIKNVLHLCKSTGVRRVFYSSSSEVYGEPVEIPQREATTPLNSRLPYAVVKNVGEVLCRAYQREHGLDFTIFRFFNTYGPRQSADFVIGRFLRASLRNDDLTIYGTGEQTRTFCYVDDNVDATTACLVRGLHVNDVVNIGSDIETSVAELVQVVLEVTGSRSKIVRLAPLAEGDMPRRKPDNTKMRRILGRDLVPLREGLLRVLERGVVT